MVSSWSSLAPVKVLIELSVGASGAFATSTLTAIGVLDPAQGSQTLTVNAASVPLASRAGDQYALWAASIRQFVAALKGVAETASAPIRSAPPETADTRKTSRSPSTSASLAAPASAA